MNGAEIGPPEKAAIMTLRQSRNMARSRTFGKCGPERSRVLLCVSLDGVGGTDPCRAPPNHLLVPCPAQLVFEGQPAFPRPNVPYHPVDKSQCRGAFGRRLWAQQQPVMGGRPRLHQMRAALASKRS